MSALLCAQAMAFTSRQKVAVTAIAQIAGPSTLTISADVLPNEAFFGQNVVIPVTVTSDPQPLETKNLKVEILYQLVDENGKPMSGLALAPVLLQKDSAKANTLRGVALIPRDDLTGIKNGGRLQYFFRARQQTGDTILNRAGVQQVGTTASPSTNNAFETSLIKTMRVAVSDVGSRVSIPDTYLADGQTSVNFEAGALSGPGFMTIRAEDANAFPAGPHGLRPEVVYSFNLEGAELRKTAQITLSYPSDLDGKVTGSRANPTDLAPYWFDGEKGWRVLSRPKTDTTLHTVTAMTPHFSTFALFASGPITAADLRPRERIITPNGDGINDTATFSGLTDGEDVQLFDVRGRRVRKVHGPNAVWDGRDDDGKTVESGVYLYQYKSQGERVSGVIMVAK